MIKNKKKEMTIDDLALIIAKTLPTKDEIMDLRHEMNRRFDKIELRLDALEERMDEVERRLDKIEYSLINQQTKRIERLELELERIKKLLPAL